MKATDLADLLNNLPDEMLVSANTSSYRDAQSADAAIRQTAAEALRERVQTKPEAAIRAPRWLTAGALAACMLFAAGVGAVLLRGHLAEPASSDMEEASGAEVTRELPAVTESAESAPQNSDTPYSTDTEPYTDGPAMYALPEFEDLSGWKTWAASELEEPSSYYNGAEICAGMPVLVRTDYAEIAPAENPGPQLRIGKPHTEMYAVSFDFFIPEDGQFFFVMYDGENTVYADDALGEERFWFRLTPTGMIERQSTFGKHYEKLRDPSGAILQVPDYRQGVWHHCYLKAADTEFSACIDNQYYAMLDELGAARSGYLALDGTSGVMFANFAFYDSTETAPVTLAPKSPPPETEKTKKTEKTVTLASYATGSTGETVTAAVTTADPAAPSYEDLMQAKYDAVLERITDRPYDEVLRYQTPLSKLHYGYVNFRQPLARNMTDTIVSFDKAAGIELLRKLDDQRMYAINRVSREDGSPGGLFYTFYYEYALMNTAWVSKTLEKSDFDDIHIGDSIEKVAALEPVTKEIEGLMSIASYADPHTQGHNQTLLLKDGVLVIHYCIPADTERLDWRITDMQFYPDFKVPVTEHYNTGEPVTIVYDYTVLPEDFPK